MSKKLVNILVPESLVATFDATASSLGRTRTNCMLDCMRDFIAQKALELKSRTSRLEELTETLERQYKLALQQAQYADRIDRMLFTQRELDEIGGPLAFVSDGREAEYENF